MKVALVTAHYPPRLSGHGDFTAKLAQALVAQGDEVVVVVLGQPDVAQLEGVSVENAVFPGSLGALRAVTQQVAELGADVVCLQFEANAFRLRSMPHLLALYLRRAGMPVAMTYHELWGSKRLGRLAKFALLNSANEVVVFSDWHAEGVRRFRKVGAAPVVIPVGTNIDADIGDRRLLRTQFDIPADEVVVTFFGFIMETHCIHELLEAISLVKDEVSVRLQLIGKFDPSVDGYQQRLVGMAKDLGISERITWHGRVEDPRAVSRLLCISDIGVLPYDTGVGENNGAFAAMAAAGLPIVTTKGDRSSLMEAAGVAEFCEPEAKSLADGIRELVAKPEKAKTIAGIAAQWSQERNWQNAAVAYSKVFRRIARDGVK